MCVYTCFMGAVTHVTAVEFCSNSSQSCFQIKKKRSYRNQYSPQTNNDHLSSSAAAALASSSSSSSSTSAADITGPPGLSASLLLHVFLPWAFNFSLTNAAAVDTGAQDWRKNPGRLMNKLLNSRRDVPTPIGLLRSTCFFLL